LKIKLLVRNREDELITTTYPPIFIMQETGSTIKVPITIPSYSNLRLLASEEPPTILIKKQVFVKTSGELSNFSEMLLSSSEPSTIYDTFNGELIIKLESSNVKTTRYLISLIA